MLKHLNLTAGATQIGRLCADLSPREDGERICVRVPLTGPEHKLSDADFLFREAGEFGGLRGALNQFYDTRYEQHEFLQPRAVPFANILIVGPNPSMVLARSLEKRYRDVFSSWVDDPCIEVVDGGVLGTSEPVAYFGYGVERRKPGLQRDLRVRARGSDAWVKPTASAASAGGQIDTEFLFGSPGRALNYPGGVPLGEGHVFFVGSTSRDRAPGIWVKGEGLSPTKYEMDASGVTSLPTHPDIELSIEASCVGEHIGVFGTGMQPRLLARGLSLEDTVTARVSLDTNLNVVSSLRQRGRASLCLSERQTCILDHANVSRSVFRDIGELHLCGAATCCRDDDGRALIIAHEAFGVIGFDATAALTGTQLNAFVDSVVECTPAVERNGREEPSLALSLATDGVGVRRLSATVQVALADNLRGPWQELLPNEERTCRTGQFVRIDALVLEVA